MRHYQVAFQKMRGSAIATHMFLFDNNHISYIDKFIASKTSPRTTVLNGFLYDLGLIADGKVTELGYNISSK